MIDLNTEHKAFEEQWKLLGGHLLYVERTSNNTYSLSVNAITLDKNDAAILLSTINTAWALWLTQARSKQMEIDALKLELAKYGSNL